MAPTSTSTDVRARQVSSVLPPGTFATVAAMAEHFGRSRADITRDLIEQGLTALRAAAEAQDRGEDGDTAAVAAVAVRADQARRDEEVMRHALGAVIGVLAEVAEDDPRRAVDMSRRAAEAMRAWGADITSSLIEEG